MLYKPFDIVITPFPFVDQLDKTKHRPALVISSEEYHKNTGCSILLMITSAKHSKMWNDHKITDYTDTNLHGECFIRQKVFTVEHGVLKGKIGKLCEIDKKEIKRILVNNIFN
jgi:mRNA interferase MazF